MYSISKLKELSFLVYGLGLSGQSVVKFFKKNKIKIQNFIDVGSHKGLYTDLFMQNYKINKVLMFEPQIKIFNFLKKKYNKNKKINIMRDGRHDACYRVIAARIRTRAYVCTCV